MPIPAEAKEKPKQTSRLVIMINEAANQSVDRYADALDPSDEPDGTSAVDVTMDLGAILFAGQSDGNEGGNPTCGSTPGAERIQRPIGYEKILADLLGGEESRAVTRDQRGFPTLNEAQINQAVTVMPASYWGLKFWTCHENGHSTFTCLYLNADQRLLFSYRYYLQKVIEDPETKRYLEEKLQHRVSIGKGRFELRESARGQERGVHFATRGINPYPGCAQPSGTRGVFNVVSEEMGPIGDERETSTEEPHYGQGDQPHPDSGHE